MLCVYVVLGLAVAVPAIADDYDIVINNSRVMDPDSNDKNFNVQNNDHWSS